MKEDNFWKNIVKESAVLNPIDRISEVLFGLIMVLSFTGAISVSYNSEQEVDELLWAALGCNIAWGFVDAIMYLMNVVIERGHARRTLSKIRHAPNHEISATILKNELQALISNTLTEEELHVLTVRIKKIPIPKRKNLMHYKDFISGLEIFLLVFLCTLPVALPFALVDDVALALRLSNLVAILLLFGGGFILAKYAGFRPFLTAIIYTLIGIFLVFVTMALGG